MTDAHTHAGDYDALLVLSFGGPEGNEEVVPFLENVTRGRGIPRERLKVVGKHYFHFDGVSPLNGLNRELIAHIEAELAARGLDLPVFFGNRNWHPFGTEAVDELTAAGKTNVLVFATSAWGGYSACRQYDEDIVKLREYAAEKGYPEIRFTKLRQFFDHPKFIAEMAAGVREGFAKLSDARLVFTAHSIPTAHDAAGGAEGDKNLYSRQVAEAARLIADAAGVEDYDLVWNSRSGNPATPWLEPDVVDHMEALAEQGAKQLVVSGRLHLGPHGGRVGPRHRARRCGEREGRGDLPHADRGAERRVLLDGRGPHRRACHRPPAGGAGHGHRAGLHSQWCAVR